MSSDKINLENYPDKVDVIVTQAPRQLMPLYISLANASVCFIKPIFSKKASSATKMGEIIAMNVPVIVNRGWGDINLMLEKNCGVFDKSILKFDDFINKTYISNSFTDSLSLEKGIMKYKQVYCHFT